jgi:hypothetical protein
MARWPDLNQCEAEKLSGSFLTLGPRSLVRCSNQPHYVVTSTPVMFGRAESGDPIGQMSMCGECFDVFKRVASEPYTWVRLVAVKS